jgi:hypothetical protein
MLKLNPDKSAPFLFTPDCVQYNIHTTSYQQYPHTEHKNSKIGHTMDPRLYTRNKLKKPNKKADKSVKIIQGTNIHKIWKQKETITTT